MTDREARIRSADAMVHEPLPLHERCTQSHEWNTPSARTVAENEALRRMIAGLKIAGGQRDHGILRMQHQREVCEGKR